MENLKDLIQCAYVKFDKEFNVIEANKKFCRDFDNINNMKQVFSPNIEKLEDDKTYVFSKIINNYLYNINLIKKNNYYLCSLCQDHSFGEFKELYNKIGRKNIFYFTIDNKKNTLSINDSKTVHLNDTFLKRIIYKDDLQLIDKRENIENKEYIDIRIKNIFRRNLQINDSEKYDWYRIYYNYNEDFISGLAININSLKEIEYKYIKMNNVLKYIRSNNVFTYKLNFTRNECHLLKSIHNYKSLDKVNKVSELFCVLCDRIIMGDGAEKLVYENIINEFRLGNIEHKIICKLMFSKDKYMWIEIKITVAKNPKTNELEGILIATDVNNETEFKHTLNNVIESNYDFIASVSLVSPYITFFDKDSLNHNILLRRCMYNQMVKEYLFVYVDKENRNDYFNEINYNAIVKKLKSKKTYLFTMATNINGEVKYKRWNFYKNNITNEVVLYSTDVTKVVSEELEKQKELQLALQRANEATDAKRKFLSQISHDIRTPMNGILGLINISLQDDIPQEVRNNLKIAYKSGDYLLELINDTLDMNMIEENKVTLNVEAFSLYENLNNIFSTFFVEIKRKKLNFIYDISLTNDLIVKTDRSKLTQILVNILSNAIKYTNENGQVKFTIKTMKTGKILKTTFIIEDTGIGMSEDFLPKLFNNYAREERGKVGGTGIGMYIVKSLVDAMNGKIEINSKINCGTKVTVHLPLEIGSKEETKLVRNNFDFKGKKILLVDDDPINIKVGRKFLERKEFIVDTAESGFEAIEKIKNYKDYNLVLMDIRMPELNGYDTTKQIRSMESEYFKNVPIIAMSANAFEEDIALSKESGMNDHISKPVKPEILYDVISKYI